MKSTSRKVALVIKHYLKHDSASKSRINARVIRNNRRGYYKLRSWHQQSHFAAFRIPCHLGVDIVTRYDFAQLLAADKNVIERVRADSDSESAEQKEQAEENAC